MTDWIPKPNPKVDLRSLTLSPEEGFVLSRLDGATAARNLPALTGLPAERLQGILTRLLSQGALLPVASAGGAPPSTTPGLRATPGAATARPAPSPAGAPGAGPVSPSPTVSPGDEPLAPEAPVEATEEELPTLDLMLDEAEANTTAPAPPASEDSPSSDTTDGPEDDDLPEVALGNYRQLFETRLHPLPEDQRVAVARGAEDPELSALCFDPVPAIIKAVMENPRTGLAHARLIARNHRNPVGLEALCARAAFTADTGVRRWLVRNPQLPSGLFRRLWSARRLMELHKVTVDRDVPESTRRSAREVLRQRFTTGPAEEKVELILNTEGRALGALVGMSVDGKTASMLCGRTYRSPMLIQNIARWSAAPPALIAHLLKQEAVRRQPQLRLLLIRHPNAPADAKRGG
ncbi:hypothetical protein MYSTI_07664 [Myxococcus stipitatus DSM 14675]|uniref:Uncharacterized protein n=1 Tax=Myxococcus stipitatus (strain DSM 14675 / JCM 12634 / Mx s8) TaxID=1278073 RepID=L7UIZ8_MYXSD|nr:hypothetical protein [Myxococcus stipitatus]AGC48936.1 hypothetical protein MYSTI_07664 [Myxococcus stipitatus DSM 14675]